MLLAPLQAHVSLRLPVLVRLPACRAACLSEAAIAGGACETVLHNPLLFDTGNEPRGKKRGENDALRNMCELHCCVSPVPLSSFSVVLFRTISSSLFFCGSPLVPTALKVSLLRDSHSFYFGRRKDGKYPACRQHMNGKLAASFFFFFFQ